MGRDDRYKRRKEATEKAAKKDRADKDALAKKATQRPQRLTRKDVALAKRSSPCPTCNGDKVINGKKCGDCNGSGIV